MLELKNVCKTFNAGTVNEKVALRGVNLTLEEGDFVTVIGGNGAGKSTTLNTVSGLLKPRSGAIEFEGKSIVGVAPNKIVSHGMALCPEGRRVFLQMTVEENLEMGGYTRPASEIEGSIQDVYKRFPRLKERYKRVRCPAANSRCWRWGAR